MKSREMALLCACGMAMTTSSCGCDAVGLPAVDLRLVDASSQVPLSFAGTRIVYEDPANGLKEVRFTARDTVPSYRLFGTGGRWRIQVERPTYAAADTAFVVETRGHCERPVLRSVGVVLRALSPIGP